MWLSSLKKRLANKSSPSDPDNATSADPSTIGCFEQRETKVGNPSFPMITFSDKASTPLQIDSQKLTVQVTLPMAKVTCLMTFVNRHSTTLEGELVFPLPDNAALTGYALDVDGVLVDAVPIDKEKAKVVFEQEVRSRGKGAAIVEMSEQSNSFKTRVYPLHPNQKKTIKVVYTMPVETTQDKKSVVHVPFGLPPGVDKSQVNIEANIEWLCASTHELKLFFNDQIEARKAGSFKNGYQVATVDQNDLNSDVQVLVVQSTHTLEDNVTIVEDAYFCSRFKVQQPETNARIDAETIQIMWDCSFSREGKVDRDVQLLTRILKELSPKQIIFTPFSNGILKKQEATFTNAQSIIRHMQEIHYDGATNISMLEHGLDESAAYCIVFTDGIHTLGVEATPETIYSIPLYIISSAVTSNSQLLSHIATKSGGSFLSAVKMSDDQVIDQIGRPILSFLVADYESEQFEEVYPNEPTILDPNGYFNLYGKIKEGGEMAVSFRYGAEIVETRVLHIEQPSDKHETSDRIVPFLWAKQKMSSMSVFPHLFEEELKQLGRDWSIVTPKTSLIVLESLEQYVKHKIMPPASLGTIRKEYLASLLKKDQSEEERVRNKIIRVLATWDGRKRWHQTTFIDSVEPEPQNDNDDFSCLIDPLTPPSTSISCPPPPPSSTDVPSSPPPATPCSEPPLPPSSAPCPLPLPTAPIAFSGPPPPALLCSGPPPPPPSSTPCLPPPPPTVYAGAPPPSPMSSLGPPPPPPASTGCAMPQTNYPCVPPSGLLRSVSRPPQLQATRSDEVYLNGILASAMSMRRSFSASESASDSSGDDDEWDEVLTPAKNSARRESSAVSAKINVQVWKSSASYMTTIQNSADPYETYLKERTGHRSSPAFFLDVADYWLTQLNELETGVIILTNILELELENAQLFRIVGYRLDQAKQYDLAEIVFEKVKTMRPDEPQSYRDLALIKEKLGKFEEAVELFNKVITGEWDMRFDEIEQTAAIELNHCLQKCPDLKPCHERFRYKMDLDLRISMAWDVNDVDIDLHVHEGCRNGEYCYYAYPRTRIGGYASRDFRQGYGPEEYMLRKAPTGKYIVEATYFANHQQSLTGGTTVLCTFFTNYMREDEKSEVVTIRLPSSRSKFSVCTISI